jgi:hypothetical protein
MPEIKTEGYTDSNQSQYGMPGITVVKSSEYPCIFFKGKNCPVRAFYALCPESLAEFCKACPWKEVFLKQAFSSPSS